MAENRRAALWGRRLGGRGLHTISLVWRSYKGLNLGPNEHTHREKYCLEEVYKVAASSPSEGVMR